MKALTGRGEFFKSTLAFVKAGGKNKKDVWLCKPTGRDLRQITNLPGEALSPSWSPDARFIVFGHMDDRTHALGVWDRLTRQTQRIKFPGNTVIGPTFMPDNKVAVSLSTGKNPGIFLLSHVFQKERALEDSASIDVSPSFDATGTKMAFCSSRLGGPQIFLKDLTTGQVTRISRSGNYNTAPSISPDGTLIAFARMTDFGHRIFVYDMVTQSERQVTFGPGTDETPSFAPDSYFLAFTSTRSGAKQIYLITRHGGDAKRVPTGPGDASFPDWGMIPD
jgi:TolB protein